MNQLILKAKFTYFTLVNEHHNAPHTSNTPTTPKIFYLFNTLGLSGGWTLKSNVKSDFAKCESCHYLKREDPDTKIHSIFTYPIIIEYITEASQNAWFERSLNHLNVEFITDKKCKSATITTSSRSKSNNYLSFYFYDQLSFGTLKATPDKSDLDKKLRELGADLMDPNTTVEVFKTQMRKKVNENKAIGNVIVNQKLIAGVGNYLRADALWMAKLSPFRKVKDVKDDELEVLYWSIISLIWGDYNYKEGMKKKLIKYKVPNDYKMDFFIYKQEKDTNGHKIIKEELYEGSQKRFIYWVKEVQK